MAVKEEWKKLADEPTIRAYKVTFPLRTRSGIIGPQIDNGINLPGGGHQYEIIDLLGENWEIYLEPVGSSAGTKLIK